MCNWFLTSPGVGKVLWALFALFGGVFVLAFCLVAADLIWRWVAS